mgnify:CR=1 FL=1
MAKGLIWFRADLRLDDNPALNAALSECEEVLAIYIFSYSALWRQLRSVSAIFFDFGVLLAFRRIC